MNYGLFCIWENNNEEIVPDHGCEWSSIWWSFSSFLLRIPFSFKNDRRWSIRIGISTRDVRSLATALAESIKTLRTKCELFRSQTNEWTLFFFFFESTADVLKNIMGELTRLYGIIDTINANQTKVYEVKQTSSNKHWRWMEGEMKIIKKTFTTIRRSRTRRRSAVDVATSVK